jgi:hypothetical protein
MDLLRITYWGLLAVVLVCITGWFAIIPDGSQARIAAAALELLKTGKASDTSGASEPILRFLAFSMQLFGQNHIALRIPGIFAILLSLYFTYRFAKVCYSFEVALLTVIVMSTTQATFLLNAGITSVHYLAVFYTFALWQIGVYLRDKKQLNLVLAMASALPLALLKNSPSEADPRYLDPLLTIIPMFIPWTIFLALGLWNIIKSLVSRQTNGIIKQDLITLLAFVLPFVLSYFSPSRSIFDVFLAYPAGALIASSFLYQVLYAQPGSTSKTLVYMHIAAGYAGLALLFCLVWFPFPENNYYGLIHFMALLSVLTWLIFFSEIRNKLVIGCVAFAIGSNVILTTYFYPNVSKYEAGAKLGMIVRANGTVPGKLLSYQAGNPGTLRFYAGAPVEETNDFGKLIATKGCWVYTHQSLLNEFRAMRPDLRIAGTVSEFQGSFWDIRFLDAESRKKLLTQKVLLRL